MNIEELEQIKEDLKAVYNVMYNFDDMLCDDMQERVNRIKKVVTAYEKEKRLAEANLKDSEEFQDNMCNHRCILNSKVEELEEELEKEKEKNKELSDKLTEKICKGVEEEILEEYRQVIIDKDKIIEELKEYKHDAELTKVACCTAQNCEALNNCIKLERELQNADKKWEDKIKAKIEDILNSENGEAIEKLIEWQSLLEKEQIYE